MYVCQEDVDGPFVRPSLSCFLSCVLRFTVDGADDDHAVHLPQLLGRSGPRGGLDQCHLRGVGEKEGVMNTDWLFVFKNGQEPTTLCRPYLEQGGGGIDSHGDAPPRPPRLHAVDAELSVEAVPGKEQPARLAPFCVGSVPFNQPRMCVPGAEARHVGTRRSNACIVNLPSQSRHGRTRGLYSDIPPASKISHARRNQHPGRSTPNS